MKYRRALLLADLRAEPGPALLALGRVAPTLESILVVAKVRALGAPWRSEPDAREMAAVESWLAAAASVAATVDVRHASELPVEAIVDLALTADVDLLVAGVRSLDSAPLLSTAGRRLGVPVLWPATETRTAPIEHLFCVAIGERSLASIAAFLREHAGPELQVTLVGPATPPSGELDGILQLLGVRARVEVISRALNPLRAALGTAARGGPIDLIVLARVPALLLVGYAWPAPVLAVPQVPSGPPTRAFDMADLVLVGGAIRGRVDELTGAGTLAPARDLGLAFIAEGQVVARALTTPSAEIELPADLAPTFLGAVRDVDDAPPGALAALEQRIAVLRPTARPLVLFDAELADARLRALGQVARDSGNEPLGVRLRPTRRARAIRARLHARGLPPHVIDARAVLTEGDAHDVGEANDPVRLRRVAARLRAAGFAVASVLDRSLAAPEPLGEALAPPISGNRIEVEVDNAQARAWLLGAITQSRHSVHLQVYIAVDDEVGRAVEAALADAAARGVSVRVLVDSLHGMHGSLGLTNPLLTRLGALPGVELRVGRPLTDLPSVTDIKQRDHRKLAIIDGRVALVGGRNLSHEYYTAFEEARLTAAAPWQQVPWLDAGARVQGPAVAAIAESFLEAWTDAGGAPFSIDTPAPAGCSAARVVVHRGLCDARTLEAYLELVEGARSHVYAVNGFPYVLELQHAMVRALRRGVRVCALTGHLTPTHEGTPFGGPSPARSTATDFIHSRLDPIVEEGGEVYLFARRGVSGWETGLGVVHAYVHAKVMSVDGLRCAVGSANFDVTSSYWESELMIVVEDEAVTRGLERRLDDLIAGSTLVNRDDPIWRERARRRQWMRRWPGVLAL